MSDLDLIVRSLTWGRLHKAAIQPAWLLRVLRASASSRKYSCLVAQQVPDDPR